MVVQDLSKLAEALGDLRVTPSVPPGRTPTTPTREKRSRRTARDPSSSWTGYIRYCNADGVVSERRFTFQSLTWCEQVTHVLGYCHERKAARTLFVDSILELACAETGELLDPRQHIEQLRMSGALGVGDADLGDLCRILSFLAKCDGEHHPTEQAALVEAIDRYCLRCDGSDPMIEAAVKGCGRLAPDSQDMLRSMRRLKVSPNGRRIARLALDSGAAIVAADGRHADEEITWALEMSEALKRVADGSSIRLLRNPP